MFCTNCGSDIPSGNKFCVECGAAVEAAATAGGVIGADSTPLDSVEPETNTYSSNSENVYDSTASDYSSTSSATADSYNTTNTSDYSTGYNYSDSTASAPAIDPELEKMGHSTMVTGIVSAAFTVSVFLSLIGVIIGIVGLTKASKTKKAGYRRPKVHVGFGLSLYSVIAGSIITLMMAYYFSMILFLVGMN